jgi:hypothetical protein
VVLHPGMPFAWPISDEDVKRFGNFMRFCEENRTELIFPKDYIIDTKNHLLLKTENEEIIDMKKIENVFYLYPEDIGIEDIE